MYICVCGHISTHTCMYTEKVCIYMLYLVEKGRVCVCVCGRAFKSMLHSMRTSSLIDRTSSYSHHELLIEWPWQHQLCW